MSRRSRRSTKKNGNFPYLVMLFIGTLFVFFVGYKFFEKKSELVEIDSNLCRLDKKFPRITAILLDATDGLNESQLENVENRVERILNSALEDEQFMVYFLNDDPDTFKPALTVCRPDDGEDANPLYEAPKKIKIAYKEQFFNPIMGVVGNLGPALAAQSSPVMEMLKFVGIRTMDQNDAPEKRLIIVSDMVENTLNYSQYKTPAKPFASLKKSPYFRQVRPRLQGVDVKIFYIERRDLNHIQKFDSHTRDFWAPFLRNSGVESVEFDNIN